MLKKLKNCLYPISKPKESLSFKEIIKPIYSVITFFGLFPYSVKFHKTKSELKIIPKSIYINTLYGVSTVLTVYVFTALHIREVFSSSDSNSMIDVLLTQINYIIELSTLIVFITVTYISCFVNRRKYVKILNALISNWNELPQNNKSYRILKHLYYTLQVFVKGGLLLVVIMQICVNFTRDDSVWKMILVTMTFNIPQTVQFITIAFYYVVVMMLIALLNNLKDNMLQLHSKPNESTRFLNLKTSPSLTLRQTELFYIKAFKIKTDINEVFQGPLMVSTLQCFHSIISEGHILYHGLVKRSLSLHATFNCSIWIVYQLLKLFIMAYSGNALKVEVVQIAQALHDIPTERQDLRFFMEIQHFSELISFQSIELTLYNCFPLDATFVYNILGSAMMYLIILVQFDKKEETV
ncbi:uncharacterized protein [Battus philenor]|uniref:uncharacterized protein n=1 Tax=Battus philenor TaxID=42288 RepID=UPI0035D09D29